MGGNCFGWIVVAIMMALILLFGTAFVSAALLKLGASWATVGIVKLLAVIGLLGAVGGFGFCKYG
jgi:hypothetical protein